VGLVIISLFILSCFGIGDASVPNPTGFATRTSYLVNGNPDTTYPLPPECKPVYFWGMVRHGARIPDEDDVLDWENRLPDIRVRILDSWLNGNSLITEDTLEYIDLWRFNITVEDAEQLTEAGWFEHMTQGQRWRSRLGDFFDPDKTEVRSSRKDRCIDSGRAYTTGLFGTESDYYVDDHIARFWDFCPKYEETVDNNEATYEQVRILDDMVMGSIQSDFQTTTGVLLDKDELVSVWSICRYETAWNKANLSPWCNLFNETSLEAFEYREDLGYYYGKSYPYNITLESVQPVWEDLISRLDEVKLGAPVQNSTVFIFSHSSAANPFMSTLGLYKDPEILTAQDWPAKDRLWKSSKIGSFATNFILIVADCEEEDNNLNAGDKQDTNYKIFLFHQEKQIPFPSGLEYLDQFIQEYGFWADIDFDENCAV